MPALLAGSGIGGRRVGRRGEADFAPASAVADEDDGGGVFEGLTILRESGEEREEVTSRCVGEDELEGHVVMKEFEADLRGAILAEEAGGARATLSERLNAIKATARGIFVLVEGPGVMEAKHLNREGLEDVARRHLEA